MDPDTFRGIEGGDVYWRRRVSVLTGVLVVVAIVAWACSSASGRPEGVASPQQTGPSGADAMVVSLPSPLASMLASPATPLGSPKGHASGSPSPSASPARQQVAKPRRPGDPCIARDLVLSLRGGQDVYDGQTDPSFLLTLVSTSKVECTIDVGPRALELRITSGPDRVWSTADCVSGEGRDVQRLERGVPYVRTVAWDRHRSGRLCGGRQPAAQPGTYIAVARMTGIRGDRSVFHLR